jgi:hypothetical protein
MDVDRETAENQAHHTNANDPRLLPLYMLHQQRELGSVEGGIVHGLWSIGVAAAIEVVEEDTVSVRGERGGYIFVD